jgi:hypothetical protein
MGAPRVGRHAVRGLVPGEVTSNFGKVGTCAAADTARPLALGAGLNYGKHNI